MQGALHISRRGYYAWKDRPPSKSDTENAALIHQITDIYERSRRTYGYPRVHAELSALKVRCYSKRGAQRMCKAAIQGCIRGRRKHTTRRDEDAVAASCPDRLWTAGITYVSTGEGFLYLAFMLEVYSRKVVGWAMANHLRTELVVDVL
jgi:putative transposase